MSLLPSFEYSLDAKTAGLGLPVGLLAASGVSTVDLQREIGAQKDRALNLIHSEGSAQVRRRITSVSEYFSARGYSCPLPYQLRMIEKKGFPCISPLVDALLVCEMTSGLLMGVQDLDAIKGDVVYDLARSGESFQGFRDVVNCTAEEIVLRDNRSIIASYFQGPNRRINVTPKTSSVLFFVFGAPKLDTGSIEEGVKIISSIMSSSSGEIQMNMYESRVDENADRVEASRVDAV